MRVARRVLTILLAAILGLAVLGIGLRIYMGREAEDRLTADEAVSISELRSPLPRASFLACPRGYCAAAEAVASPIFEQPVDRLRTYWGELISGEVRLMAIAADPRARRFAYVQHSPVFRFPDVIVVEFIPLGRDRSSIAVYSRSRYGRYDFGKNRKRVEKWLVLLERMARPATLYRAGAR